ncbi:MAG: hypothetical protein WBO73_11830, partial [Gammaproteobacteria bacterium]
GSGRPGRARGAPKNVVAIYNLRAVVNVRSKHADGTHDDRGGTADVAHGAHGAPYATNTPYVAPQP